MREFFCIHEYILILLGYAGALAVTAWAEERNAVGVVPGHLGFMRRYRIAYPMLLIQKSF